MLALTQGCGRLAIYPQIVVSLGHSRAFTDSQAALWQSAGKWLQSFNAHYLAFLTDQLLDYASHPSARAAL